MGHLALLCRRTSRGWKCSSQDLNQYSNNEILRSPAVLSLAEISHFPLKKFFLRIVLKISLSRKKSKHFLLLPVFPCIVFNWSRQEDMETKCPVAPGWDVGARAGVACGRGSGRGSVGSLSCDGRLCETSMAQPVSRNTGTHGTIVQPPSASQTTSK